MVPRAEKQNAGSEVNTGSSWAATEVASSQSFLKLTVLGTLFLFLSVSSL